MIVVVDFGSQTAHLIGRRLSDLGVEVKIIGTIDAVRKIENLKAQGIILSGGPVSVYEKSAPKINSQIFELKIPILGICYGWQLMAFLLKGLVESGKKEYGPTQIKVLKKGKVFKKFNVEKFGAWMSHGDEVVKLPPGFECLASTSKIKFAAAANFEKRLYGIQFHPEVEHTKKGKLFLKNFAVEVCGLKLINKSIEVGAIINNVRKVANQYGENSKAIVAISGGVDSTVSAVIVARAIGNRLILIYCDNGLMRRGTKKEVNQIFKEDLGIKPIIVRCKGEFFKALKGVVDPEKKRLIIGKLYIKIFERIAKKLSKKDKTEKFLVQGTIYSDVIESKGTDHAGMIKSHHNVGGLPEKMKLKLLEPVRHLYKDEVREVGRQLGLSETTINKQPFPGPGLAIRIIGEVSVKRAKRQQQADSIVLEEIRRAGLYKKVFQSFPVLTGVKSTAVKGDHRFYGEVIALRIYGSSDIMSASWSRLPAEVLQKMSSRIVNEVEGVSRVVYDITTKPPATMEWE